MEELEGNVVGRGKGKVTAEGVGAVIADKPQQPEERKAVEVGGLVAAIRKIRPGDLKARFVRSLVQGERERGGAFDFTLAVRRAKIAVAPPEEGVGQLEVEGVLGNGAFGVITAVRHTVLPGEFALKTLKEVSLRSSCIDPSTIVQTLILGLRVASRQWKRLIYGRFF